jgi:hypothetical protein
MHMPHTLPVHLHRIIVACPRGLGDGMPELSGVWLGWAGLPCAAMPPLFSSGGLRAERRRELSMT